VRRGGDDEDDEDDEAGVAVYFFTFGFNVVRDLWIGISI
jgi:hypothetical protein